MAEWCQNHTGLPLSVILPYAERGAVALLNHLTGVDASAAHMHTGLTGLSDMLPNSEPLVKATSKYRRKAMNPFPFEPLKCEFI